MKRKTFKTNRVIQYSNAPYGYIATIPIGTFCEEAFNLPLENGNRRYWAKNWRGMTNKARSWGYGFLIEQDCVEVK